jgi:hypothetical protein
LSVERVLPVRFSTADRTVSKRRWRLAGSGEFGAPAPYGSAGWRQQATRLANSADLGMSRRESDSYPAGCLGNAGTNLDQAYVLGGELRSGQRLRLWDGLA